MKNIAHFIINLIAFSKIVLEMSSKGPVVSFNLLDLNVTSGCTNMTSV